MIWFILATLSIQLVFFAIIATAAMYDEQEGAIGAFFFSLFCCSINVISIAALTLNYM